MKPHSVNYFVFLVAFTGLMLLALIGVNMVHEIRRVEQTFVESHLDSAKQELQRGIDAVVARAEEIADRIASWDETSQQLSDPTYYQFWRQRRVNAVQVIPGYVQGLELYAAKGTALQVQAHSAMPNTIPVEPRFFAFEGQRPWLYVFKPIMLHGDSVQIFGYVGLKLDVLAALPKLNLFTHLDFSSVNFDMPPASRVPPQTIIDHVQLKELHHGELDELKNVVYETFAYIVGLIIVILFILYWMVMALFARPLIRLNQHIESTKKNAAAGALPENALNFSVNELNNFARSLQEYQLRLNLTQENLQKLNNDLELRVKARTADLQASNRELEAFSYSVSHDLRAPLRSIDGYSQALLEDCDDKLDETGKHYLRRIRANAQRMAQLIDDLLTLARIARAQLNVSLVSLSEIAHKQIRHLQEQHPERSVSVDIQEQLYAQGDEQLLTVMLNNLLSNAWKYSSQKPQAAIEFGTQRLGGENVFYIRDNGTGFEMKYVHKIFEVFQRLHGSEFEGTGIGLATVSRIVKRHNGRIWAEAEPGQGACFYFTLGAG